MIPIPSASQAREGATLINKTRYDDERAKVFNSIKLAIQAGEYAIETKKLSTGLRTELDDLGYKIKDSYDGQDQVTYSQIGW